MHHRRVVPSFEELADDDRARVAVKDLNMFVLVGGKERTRDEFATLLEAAGFELVDVHHDDGLDVIEAVAT